MMHHHRTAMAFDEENQCIVRIINIVGFIVFLMVLNRGRLLSLAITRPVHAHLLAIDFGERNQCIVRIKPFGWLIDILVGFGTRSNTWVRPYTTGF